MGDKTVTSAEVQEVIEAFKVFDHCGTGTVSVETLRQILGSMGDEPMTAAEVEEVICNAEVDDAGNINYKAFIEPMLGNDCGGADDKNQKMVGEAKKASPKPPPPPPKPPPPSPPKPTSSSSTTSPAPAPPAPAPPAPAPSPTFTCDLCVEDLPLGERCVALTAGCAHEPTLCKACFSRYANERLDKSDVELRCPAAGGCGERVGLADAVRVLGGDHRTFAFVRNLKTLAFYNPPRTQSYPLHCDDCITATVCGKPLQAVMCASLAHAFRHRLPPGQGHFAPGAAGHAGLLLLQPRPLRLRADCGGRGGRQRRLLHVRRLRKPVVRAAPGHQVARRADVRRLRRGAGASRGPG